MRDQSKNSKDERAPERKGGLEAQLDELGNDPSQVGPEALGKPQARLGFRTSPMQRKIQWKILRIQIRLSRRPQWKALKMPPTIPNAPPTPMKSTAARMTCRPENVEATQHDVLERSAAPLFPELTFSLPAVCAGIGGKL